MSTSGNPNYPEHNQVQINPEDLPQPFRVVFLANFPELDGDDPENKMLCDTADLVVSLGGVNLHEASKLIPEGVPGLCVFGPNDVRSDIPRKFRYLHASGFKFRNWVIAGLSGAPAAHGQAQGFRISDQEAFELLEKLPPVDILLTHAPPMELTQSGTDPADAFMSIDRYIDARPPFFHFYAHPEDHTIEDHGEHTRCIGVNGILPLIEPETMMQIDPIY